MDKVPVIVDEPKKQKTMSSSRGCLVASTVCATVLLVALTIGVSALVSHYFAYHAVRKADTHLQAQGTNARGVKEHATYLIDSDKLQIRERYHKLNPQNQRTDVDAHILHDFNTGFTATKLFLKNTTCLIHKQDEYFEDVAAKIHKMAEGHTSSLPREYFVLAKSPKGSKPMDRDTARDLVGDSIFDMCKNYPTYKVERISENEFKAMGARGGEKRQRRQAECPGDNWQIVEDGPYVYHFCMDANNNIIFFNLYVSGVYVGTWWL